MSFEDFEFADRIYEKHRKHLEAKIVDLLYDLHSNNKLDLVVINCITENLSVNALELCEKNGITYNEE